MRGLVSEWVSEWVSELVEDKAPLWNSRELLLWETGSCGRGQFENPEEGERPPLKATTKQRLVKTVKIRSVLEWFVRNDVFCGVRAEVLYAWQLRVSQLVEWNERFG
jgi:hypothetical protein